MVRCRRPVLLLEVIIAAFLVALVAVPLLRPSVGMLIREKKAISRLEEEKRLSNIYGDMIVSLYRQEISWEEITDGAEHEQEGFSFQFTKRKHKPSGKDAIPKYYLMWMTLRLNKSGAKQTYPIMLERRVPEAADEK
jgi:hypothetical protein